MRPLAKFGLPWALAAAVAAQGDLRVTWKPVPMAFLRVDDAAPKDWKIYRAEKRKQSLLVQIGARFLLLDVERKRVYELAPRTITRSGESALQWQDPGEPAAARPAAATSAAAAQSADGDSSKPDELPAKQLLASSNWNMRDVGPMLRIVLRLTAEGRDFDIQIPIQPDLRQFY